MEPSSNSKQDGAVNMTRAMEALSPWLKHPRKTIIQVEALVIAAAALLLLQLILGSCRRRWHNSFIKYGLQVCNGIMFPLTVYTLGTMQSSPVKNSSYPVWAGFLIMASAGTTAVQQYDFYDSFYKKCLQVSGEFFRDLFYVWMFNALMDPSNTYTMKAAFDLKTAPKLARTSSHFVWALVLVVLGTKFSESISLLRLGYKHKWGALVADKNSGRRQAAESTEETTANDGESASNPQSMKGNKYVVSYRLHGGGAVTIDQIWDCCRNAADAYALKDLCLSCALFGRLVRQRYFGYICYLSTSLLTEHDFVFKKMLPPQGDFKRAFRIIEVELGFCYDFFFTKYYCVFAKMNSPTPLFQITSLLKIILVLIVGVLANRKSLILETPNPIIEVQISEADYIITLLVLSIALLVELVQAAFYLASNWAQVSLACMHVKKHWFEPNAYIFGKFICLLRWVMISTKLRNKIDQHSVIFAPKQQPDPVEVSDAVKTAIATSLRSTYANNLTNDEEISARLQNQMLGEYSWALSNLSQLEVILIWHIATEYCNTTSYDPNDDNGPPPSSNHRGGHLFGYVLQWLRPDPRRNRIASDSHRGVAVHLSRYYAYLIRSVPELLPYHEVDIEELIHEVMEERRRYPRTMLNRGVKLGKQLERKLDRWEVLQDFWAKKIIEAAASHYTTKQHMQHLENGGEFLTHIWALLAHAGILSLKRNKDQEGQTNLESGPPAAA